MHVRCLLACRMMDRPTDEGRRTAPKLMRETLHSTIDEKAQRCPSLRLVSVHQSGQHSCCGTDGSGTYRSYRPTPCRRNNGKKNGTLVQYVTVMTISRRSVAKKFDRQAHRRDGNNPSKHRKRLSVPAKKTKNYV